ncbi:helix-turn-helix domain-containing protein [Salmonella enterica]|nr:helix-turn-helix domain-containing protein [Salmonella enterica]EJK6202427.1 helix-turn-helix domain-containing protein [Salmonella enterica]EJT3500831.1 helix-turn-helix domain-containing protein [Salmonella enterica]
MNFDDQFPSRVSMARQSRGMTQAQLSKLAGVVQRQIAAYEGGEAKPRLRVLQALANALGTTAEWLALGEGQGPGTKNVMPDVLVKQIPILKLDEVMHYLNTGEHSSSRFHPAIYNVGDSAFALTIEGEAMTTSSGISFPRGSVVTFSPLVKAKSKDYVIASLDKEQILSFKQVYIGEIETNLASLNPMYPNILVRNEDVSILATAVYLEIPLL